MKEILIEFGSLALAVSSAIIAVINAIVSARRSYKLSQELDAAKERETYIECPHCSKKIRLSEMYFRLPSGALDNDLNGKPDED